MFNKRDLENIIIVYMVEKISYLKHH